MDEDSEEKKLDNAEQLENIRIDLTEMEELYDSEVNPDEFSGLYEEAIDEEGLAEGYEELEPDPERWATILEHRRFHDSLTQLDTLMEDYGYQIELQIGKNSFSQVNHDSQSLPEKLNLYISTDPEELRQNVNHPIFEELGTNIFTVPHNSTVGLAFGEYEHVIDIPENYEYLDIKTPTLLAHSKKRLEDMMTTYHIFQTEDQKIQ